MSPEQARGEVSTTAADLWSFGLLLVELLTRKTPWPVGLGSQELLQHTCRAEVAIPTGLPRLETRLLRRLLAPDPQARPSARETREALRVIVARPARRLRLALAAPAATSTVQSFNNTAPITINVQGNATPYPSNITVSGVPTNFTRLEVQLNGFSRTYSPPTAAPAGCQ